MHVTENQWNPKCHSTLILYWYGNLPFKHLPYQENSALDGKRDLIYYIEQMPPAYTTSKL